jgi:uncharacterized protein (DUF1697 family)
VATFVALLRGINVGGKHVLAMARVREAFTAAGGGEVETYIQSGNVVFSHATRSATTLAHDLEQRLAKVAGFAVPVMLRTATEIARVLEHNPFPAAEVDQLHVAFMRARPADNALAAIELAKFAPESCALVGRELYLRLPNGIGRSKLAVALARPTAIASSATTRNLRTVIKLHELASAR